METIFCIDNSGSTRNVEAYWKKVSALYIEKKPSELIYWNTTAGSSESLSDIERNVGGGTAPQVFITALRGKKVPYNLVITTDGEISHCDIEETKIAIQETKVYENINSVSIYYVGRPESMNIALNVIFSHYNKNVEYCVNDDNPFQVTDIKQIENLTFEEVSSDNFLISLTTHIYNARNNERFTNELRGSICRLFGRLRNTIPGLKSSEEYFLKNMKKEFFQYLKIQMDKVKPISQLESRALSLFDKNLDLSLSRLYNSTLIENQTLPIEHEIENSCWETLECSIVSISFKLPCLLVKNVHTPIITNKKYHIHPFLVLSDGDLIKDILKQIEPNLIDYTTYQKLQHHNEYINSPFTRDLCKGVFALDVSNMSVVKNNCRTISPLFSDGNKVPGNLVIWNLIFMYLIYRYKLDDLEVQEKASQSIISYTDTLKANLSLTHYCQVFMTERLSICFWFCLDVGPSISPNTSRNVLRSPFGLELLEFYLYVFHNKSTLDDLKEEDQKKKEELTILIENAKKWRVWNYLVTNKSNKTRLHFEVMAQVQNYHILNNHSYILVSGSCELPFKSVVSLISPGLGLALYTNLEETSSKTNNIDSIRPLNSNYFKNAANFNIEKMLHVKINVRTCWPFVICPVTKLHWRQCIGEYDIKGTSFFRLFNRFCKKYRKYPENPIDLILFYNNVCKNPIFPENYMEAFTYLFNAFGEIMEKYDCNKYILTYESNVNEEIRLEKEIYNKNV